VHAGHEDFPDVGVAGAALETRASGEVIRADGLIVAVRERGSRRAIPAAFRTMTFPALQFLKKFLAVLDARHGERRFGGHYVRRAGLLVLPARRKGLNK